MFLLLMIFLERHGFTLWRTKMKYSVSSRNSKPWSRTILKRRSRPVDQIMEDNSLRINSKSYAKNQGLRGICLLLIIHNRMGLRNGRIEPSWKLQEKCFMIKIFLCIFGLKLPEQRCMYRTVLHIEYSRTRLLKKSSPARNQKSTISDYSAVLYTYTFQKKREQN